MFCKDVMEIDDVAMMGDVMINVRHVWFGCSSLAGFNWTGSPRTQCNEINVMHNTHNFKFAKNKNTKKNQNKKKQN